MTKLAKYLKPFIGSIIAVIALLFIQAISELSLPDYMSNIVNVGIQQGGIENATPDVIRKTQLEKLSIFIGEDDLNFIEENYSLIDRSELSNEEFDEYIKKYPILDKEALYELNTKDEDKISKLNSILAKPELVVYGIEKGEFDASMLGNMQSNMQLPANTDPFMILKNIPKEQLNNIVDAINEKFSEMPDSMVEQAAVSYVKNEYSEIGINTDKLQTNAIIISGLKMLGIALLSMVASVIVGLISARIAAGLGKSLRGDVFKKVTSFSNSEFDKFSTASLIICATSNK